MDSARASWTAERAGAGAALRRWAAALSAGAVLELRLTPKPGLVDLADSGSHPDLTFELMERSVRLVSEALGEMAASLARGEPFGRQEATGIAAEERLRAELGTNTHKGFLFLASLLMIARWRAGRPAACAVRDEIAALARLHFARPAGPSTHGEAVRRRFGRGGVVLEALQGLPSLFEVALPAWRAAMSAHGEFRAASFLVLARLMQTVEDTTALHRCGEAGLRRLRKDGRRLEAALSRGDDVEELLERLNGEYAALNLTMGGVADVLGLAYGYLIATGELSCEPAEVKIHHSGVLCGARRTDCLYSLQP